MIGWETIPTEQFLRLLLRLLLDGVQAAQYTATRLKLPLSVDAFLDLLAYYYMSIKDYFKHKVFLGEKPNDYFRIELLRSLF